MRVLVAIGEDCPTALSLWVQDNELSMMENRDGVHLEACISRADWRRQPCEEHRLPPV